MTALEASANPRADFWGIDETIEIPFWLNELFFRCSVLLLPNLA
jgi:hypothetical protein